MHVQHDICYHKAFNFEVMTGPTNCHRKENNLLLHADLYCITSIIADLMQGAAVKGEEVVVRGSVGTITTTGLIG